MKSFQTFIDERGPSYRTIDLFDDELDRPEAHEFDTHSTEMSDQLKSLRDKLLINELPNWAKSGDIQQALPAETISIRLVSDI